MGADTPHECHIKVERLEERFGGLERQQSLLNQQLQIMLNTLTRHDQKLFGVDGTPGLLVEVDRLNRLNTNERFKETGQRIKALEEWRWKMVGAAMVGSVVGSMLMKAVL